MLKVFPHGREFIFLDSGVVGRLRAAENCASFKSKGEIQRNADYLQDNIYRAQDGPAP